MPDSILNCDDAAAADVVLIGAPYDGTSSFGKGADQGPSAIRECLNRQIEFYDRVSKTTPVEELKIAFLSLNDLASCSPEQMVEELEREYSLHSGKFRVLLGGEHSVTNAPLRHFSSESQSITVVQIDAHADLREDDSDYASSPAGKYAHCSVMKRAYDLGFNLVQVGVRTYSREERELFSDQRINVFEWSQEKPEISVIIEAIPTEKIYLTIDADGLDPAHMPATGTPVPGGLEWHYCNDLIQRLFQRKTVIGADIVEVAPRTEDVLTEYAAAQLCYTLIGCYLAK